ncbi:hypothetical protein [Emticicia fontis]
MQAITSYFGEFLFWDVYVQGILASLFILIGISLWIYTLAEYFNPNENMDLIEYIKKNYTGLYDLVTVGLKLKIARYVSYFAISLTVIYNVGVYMTNFSDDFMDASNSYHLYLKKYWADMLDNKEHHIDSEKFPDLSDTDEMIKIRQFDSVFHIPKKDTLASSTDTSINKEFLEKVFKDSKGAFRKDVYYFAKHAILADKDWRGYITYSQNLINITQVASLSSFILFCMCLINFFFDFLRIIKEIFFRDNMGNVVNLEKGKSVKKNKLIIYLCVAILSLILYSFFKINFILPFFAIFIITWLGCWIFSISIEWIGKRTRATLIISIFSMITYFIAAKSWQANEKEICNKIYGVFIFKEKQNLAFKYIDELFKTK